MERGRLCTEKSCFSFDTVKRLSLYLRNLKRLKEKGIEVISSERITPLLNVSSAQFRKDLSYFGEFGKRGVGYEVGRLIRELEEILGTNKEWRIALVGVGRLGEALLGFEGFSKFNLRIVCAFDIDKKKIGKIVEGVKVEDMKNLKTIIKRKKVKIALLCTPPHFAQEVSEKLVAAGIRGILNFSPLILKVPSSVFVSNVDMACELESLIFFLKRNETKN